MGRGARWGVGVVGAVAAVLVLVWALGGFRKTTHTLPEAGVGTRVDLGRYALTVHSARLVDMSYGAPQAPRTAQARVVELRRLPSLTAVGVDTAVRTTRPLAGGVFVLAVVECRFPQRDGVLAPATQVVDDRGRVWDDTTTLDDDYDQLGGLPPACAIDDPKRVVPVDGVITYGTLFEVLAYAAGLGVFVDPYEHNWLYR